jgi:succinate dehydrogenase/fumarate reductase flavoprotein subunit
MGGDFTLYNPLRVSYPQPLGKAGFPLLPNSEHMDKYNVKGTEADGPPSKRLFDLLSKNVEKRNIKVLTNTPAKELVMNEKGEVVGVIAEKDGKKLAIKARKAVVMTCGGFEYNAEMKRDYLPVKFTYAHGNPGNTGDGIRMVNEIGAQLWHMTALACNVGFKAPEYDATFHIMFLSPAFIYVDKNAKRFINEGKLETHLFWVYLSYLDTDHATFPRIPTYAIFSEEARKRGALYPGTSGYNRDKYKWSLDNSAEIARGWITKANSVSELASKIELDAATLEKTMVKYNQDAKAGMDTDFGRTKEHLRAVDGPPYYAIKLWPCLLNTQGGPRRDIEGRVLDANGKPIPRLYAAGEFGSIWGFLYQGANNVGECIAFGRISGKNAAMEKPW